MSIYCPEDMTEVRRMLAVQTARAERKLDPLNAQLDEELTRPVLRTVRELLQFVNRSRWVKAKVVAKRARKAAWAAYEEALNDGDQVVDGWHSSYIDDLCDRALRADRKYDQLMGKDDGDDYDD